MWRLLLLLAAMAGPLAPHDPAQAQPASRAQFGPLAPPGLPAARFPRPDRPVAEIVSPTRATEAFRDRLDEAGQVSRALGIGPGTAVADIGAGDGYHTRRLAPLVAPGGRVIAQDVTRRYLEELAKRVRAAGLENVMLGLGEPHDPRLPAASADVALLAHVYHEIAHPYALLYNLVPALRPGARVGIVDLDRPTAAHGTPPALLRCELEAVGYQQTGFFALGDELGYLAVFAAPEAAARPDPASIVPCRGG